MKLALALLLCSVAGCQTPEPPESEDWERQVDIILANKAKAAIILAHRSCGKGTEARPAPNGHMAHPFPQLTSQDILDTIPEDVPVVIREWNGPAWEVAGVYHELAPDSKPVGYVIVIVPHEPD